MYDSGLATVGLHTDRMHNIDEETNAPPFLDERKYDAFDKDTKTSIKKYKEVFNEDPLYFAYPHGFGTEGTDQILVENGFEMLFTLYPGAIDNDTSKTLSPVF